MTNLIKKILITASLFLSGSIFSMQGLSVITITTDDPEGYVEWLTTNSSVFQEAAGDDVSSSGICSPIAGGDMWSVMKGDAVGEAGTTNANYNVMSETDDANAYLAGITALEKAANDNGFAVSFAFYSATAAGDRAGMVMVSVQAETVDELGRFLDQRQSSWMSEALSEFDVVRNPVEDFLMNCSTISVNS